MVKYAATLALLSVAVMCGTLSYSIVTVNKHLSATLMKLDTEIDEAHRLTLEAGLTVMEARKASVKEVQYLDAWNKGISQALTDFHTAMITTTATVAGIQPVETAATDTLNQTRVMIQALEEPVQQLDMDLAALQPVIAHTDALVSNPALTATISNVESTTGHLDATAADVQQEVHSLTHPTWLHKLWGGLLDVAHVFNPL